MTIPIPQPSHSSTTPVVIAVMGATGSGKTTFINLLSRSNLVVGRGLKSCTNKVERAQAFRLDGFSVTLVDTPGFDDTTKSDTEILNMIAAHLSTSYQQGIKLAGIIYIHRITDIRVGGTSKRNFKMFRELCGDRTLKNVIIVTNMWGKVSLEEGEARQAELASQDMFFKPILDKGGQLVRHDNTLASAQAILQCVIRNHPMALRIQEELVDEHKDLSHTAAGEELNRELIEQARRHKHELQSIRDDMKKAIQDRDEETRKELEEESKKLHAEMIRVQTDSQQLASRYDEEKARLEREINETRESERRERERAAAEHTRLMREISDQLQNSRNAAEHEKAELRRRMEDLQRQVNDRGPGCTIQ